VWRPVKVRHNMHNLSAGTIVIYIIYVSMDYIATIFLWNSLPNEMRQPSADGLSGCLALARS
jgi:hypothetical protein